MSRGQGSKCGRSSKGSRREGENSEQEGRRMWGAGECGEQEGRTVGEQNGMRVGGSGAQV